LLFKEANKKLTWNNKITNLISSNLIVKEIVDFLLLQKIFFITLSLLYLF
jgi:hypothetical protein